MTSELTGRPRYPGGALVTGKNGQVEQLREKSVRKIVGERASSGLDIRLTDLDKPALRPQILRMNFDYQPLTACFNSDVMAKQSIGLYQTCGFTLAVAGAPETISPLEWLPCLFNEDRLPDFPSDVDREKTIELLVHLTDHWTTQIQQRAPEDALLDLPQGCYFVRGKGPSQSTRDFCKGYLSGYRWLQKAWDMVLRDIDAEDREKLVFNATVMACLTLLYADDKGEKATMPDRDLPMKPAKAWHLLPALLIETGGFGLDRQKAAPDHKPSPAISEKIERNAPCPCGSGKKYKKCCMN